MSEILRDPMWQFIATVLAITAILVSIILYLKQRRCKAVSYEILSQTPLLSVKGEIKGQLEILYKGKPVQQVHLVLVRIINSGNTPILSTDYKLPISLNFGEEANILTSAVVKADPRNVQAALRVEGRNAVLVPTLLNTGDSVTLKMLVTKFEEVKVDGRIVGVKKIKESKKGPRFFLLYIIFAILVQFLTGLFFCTIS